MGTRHDDEGKGCHSRRSAPQANPDRTCRRLRPHQPGSRTSRAAGRAPAHRAPHPAESQAPKGRTRTRTRALRAGRGTAFHPALPRTTRPAFSPHLQKSAKQSNQKPYPARHGAEAQDGPHLYDVAIEAQQSKMETIPSPSKTYLRFATHFRCRAHSALQPCVTSSKVLDP